MKSNFFTKEATFKSLTIQENVDYAIMTLVQVTNVIFFNPGYCHKKEDAEQVNVLRIFLNTMDI